MKKKKRVTFKSKATRRKETGIPYDILERAAKAGLTNEQIALVCGVKRDALQKWMVNDVTAAGIMREGREEPNLRVENSLFRRALGYNVVEITEANGGRPVTRKHKHVTASVRAIEMWLYNRDPDRWKKQVTLNVRNMSLKDKTELAQSGYGDELD